MKIGIVGYGYVGRSIASLFSKHFLVSIYDKFDHSYSSHDNKQAVNESDLVFISVPTPAGADGWECNIDALYEVFSWLEAPACIKSTVPPGTTQQLSELFGIPVGFSPEYLGEHRDHAWKSIISCGFVIVGGPPFITEMVTSAYKMVEPAIRVTVTSSRAAELCKYMENSFLATKVAFVNQFYDIALSLDVDFQTLLDLWLHDPRIGASHTTVTSERGFGGKCLPKDIRAIIAVAHGKAPTPLLQAVVRYNDDIRAGAASSKSPHRETVDTLEISPSSPE